MIFKKGGDGSGRYPKGSGEANRKKTWQETIAKLPDMDGSEVYGDMNVDVKGVSYDEAKTILNSISKDGKNKSKAISIYGASDYIMINDYVRTGKVDLQKYRSHELEGIMMINGLSGTKQSYLKHAKSGSAMLDESMTDELDEDRLLYRGIGKKSHPLAQALNQKKNIVNTVFTEESYASSSLRSDHEWGDGEGYNMIIIAPKGTKGLAFDSKKYPVLLPQEAEFCLPRNCSFLVRGYDTKTRTALVELIDNGITP